MNTELGFSGAIVIFLLGCYGLLVKKDGLKLIISLEFLIIAANLFFISIASMTGALDLSQTYVILLLSIGGPLIGFGILLVILIQSRFGQIDISSLNNLRW